MRFAPADGPEDIPFFTFSRIRAVLSIQGKEQVITFLVPQIPDGKVGIEIHGVAVRYAVRRVVGTVQELAIEDRPGQTGLGVVCPSCPEAGTQVEPYLTRFLLQFHIGSQGIGIIFSAFPAGGSQIPVIQKSDPVGFEAGVRVCIFEIDPDGRFYTLDTSGICIEADLCRGGKAL